MRIIMRKVVVASDSFKGCLSSAQVADAVEKGIHEVYPDCDVVKLAVADGGEGTIEALATTLGGCIVKVQVQDPLGRPITSEYAIVGETTAVIEMSTASGLTLLNEDERNPMLTSTFGTGQMVADALSKGCRRFIMGIGGSATNDAGTGMLEALGYRFMDAEGNVLKGRGESLGKIKHVDSSNAVVGLKDSSFIVACDVDSPFCGPKGAAYVYGPQKGATPEMVKELDEGMQAFSRLVYKETGTDIMNIKGAGAAGGLGGALKAFLDADLKKGADMVLDAIGFDQMIENADLVITGEGKIDSQTLNGKLPSAVARRASGRNIPVMAICGRTEVESLPCFASICPVTPQEISLEQAMQLDIAMENIKELFVRDIALSVTN
jgi:glycerate kinase